MLACRLSYHRQCPDWGGVFIKPPRHRQVLDEALLLALCVDSDSRRLAVRPALPPSNAPTRELWSALEARGQLQLRLSALAGMLGMGFGMQRGVAGEKPAGHPAHVTLHMKRSSHANTLPLLSDDLLRHVMEPLLKGEGKAVLSVSPPSAAGLPAVLAWGELAPGQQYKPEACCQKVGQPENCFYAPL